MEGRDWSSNTILMSRAARMASACHDSPFREFVPRPRGPGRSSRLGGRTWRAAGRGAMRGAMLDGRYELVERLGRGAMGQVWGARDKRMQRDVAVKLVTALPRLGEHETFLRFQREIRSAAGLPGRHTVIAHDCGEADVDGERALYMVMERLTGRTLSDAVVEQRPHWTQAVDWGRQVAQALDAAHGQGIVHRDIKPDNIMFAGDGDLKVLDFGIAKFLGDTVLVSGLTGTGVVMGTLLYMSPEQARGERSVDHRTDLYSFGCVLYFMLTGRPPLVADNQFAQMHLIAVGQVEPPHLLNPEIPAGLSALVMHLLAREPDARPAAAREVVDRLAGLEGRPVSLPSAAHPVDADALVEEARRAAERHLRLAESAAEQVRDDAEAYASQLRAEAQKDAQSKREEADALFEETRAKAAQAAADFETNLAKRREQSERDVAARQTKSEKRLAEIEHRAEQLRLEAEKLRVDAERRARQTVETAQRHAVDIVAAADARAERILGLDTLSTLRETVAAILADSKFTPVGGLVEQRAAILGQLSELKDALSALPTAQVRPNPYEGDYAQQK
ncbi:serine/threonine protein kinase [Streptomyces ipomoeae]|uniref:serine/threonine protein kinase n=2 Tax=Streptomyces ipomoeae TaxID=103232 RepID=UPI001147A113|nr:serine/threonine protein kinase [Streptomyces ipomoeae]